MVPQLGGVAIVRVSGDDAVSIAERMFRPGRPAQSSSQHRKSAWVAESHRAHYGCVYDDDGRLVDEARPAAPPATCCCELAMNSS